MVIASKHLLHYIQSVDDTRDRILDAAHGLFARYGFKGATTRRIAAEAGVNEVTLFRQFACKDDLLREAVERQSRQAVQALDEHRLPATPCDLQGELVRFLMGTHFGFVQARQAVRTSMAEWGQHPSLQEPLLRTLQGIYDELRTYLKAAQVRGLVRSDLGVAVMAHSVLAVVLADALLRDMMTERFPLKPGASLDAYLDVVLEGLAVTEEGPAG